MCLHCQIQVPYKRKCVIFIFLSQVTLLNMRLWFYLFSCKWHNFILLHGWLKLPCTFGFLLLFCLFVHFSVERRSHYIVLAGLKCTLLVWNSLCSPKWPQTHQELPASGVLGLYLCVSPHLVSSHFFFWWVSRLLVGIWAVAGNLGSWWASG